MRRAVRISALGPFSELFEMGTDRVCECVGFGEVRMEVNLEVGGIGENAGCGE